MIASAHASKSIATLGFAFRHAMLIQPHLSLEGRHAWWSCCEGGRAMGGSMHYG